MNSMEIRVIENTSFINKQEIDSLTPNERWERKGPSFMTNRIWRNRSIAIISGIIDLPTYGLALAGYKPQLFTLIGSGLTLIAGFAFMNSIPPYDYRNAETVANIYSDLKVQSLTAFVSKYEHQLEDFEKAGIFTHSVFQEVNTIKEIYLRAERQLIAATKGNAEYENTLKDLQDLEVQWNQLRNKFIPTLPNPVA